MSEATTLKEKWRDDMVCGREDRCRRSDLQIDGEVETEWTSCQTKTTSFVDPKRLTGWVP